MRDTYCEDQEDKLPLNRIFEDRGGAKEKQKILGLAQFFPGFENTRGKDTSWFSPLEDVTITDPSLSMLPSAL